MKIPRFPVGSAVLAAAVLLAPHMAGAVTAKKTPDMVFLYRQNLGPYARIAGAIEEFRTYLDEHGLEGPIIGIYYDNPVRTAPSLQQADLGVRISMDKALELLKAARPEAEEDALRKEMESDRGAMIEDPNYIRLEKSMLVAAERISEPFDQFFRKYQVIQEWIWSNGYYLVGPVREVYLSPVSSEGTVRAEIQIGIERTGVPDRR